MLKIMNRLRIKKTSWFYVLLCPDRWAEAFNYLRKRNTRQIGAAGDLPDPRDIHAKLSSADKRVKIPKTFSLRKKAEKLNWVSARQSKNACTCYSKSNGVEITNTIEHGTPQTINPEALWALQEQTGGSREHGDFIQNAEKQFHANPQGYPQTEYGRLRRQENTVIGAKLWLLRMETIRTGLYWKWITSERTTNSSFMKRTGEFKSGVGDILGGHAFVITGWDDARVNSDGTLGAFEALESEKMKWGNNPPGVFWIKYSDFHNIFSKYVSRDTWDI